MKPAELDLDAIPKRSRKKVIDLTDMEPKAGSRKAAAWRRIIVSLRKDGPQTKDALSKNLAICEEFVEHLIKWFVKHGMVVRVGRKYKLDEKHADYGKIQPRKARTPRAPRPTSWSKVLDEDD